MSATCALNSLHAYSQIIASDCLQNVSTECLGLKYVPLHFIFHREKLLHPGSSKMEGRTERRNEWTNERTINVSVGKGIWGQVWLSQFDPWDPHGGQNQLPHVVFWPLHVSEACVHVCMNIHIYRETHINKNVAKDF